MPNQIFSYDVTLAHVGLFGNAKVKFFHFEMIKCRCPAEETFNEK